MKANNPFNTWINSRECWDLLLRCVSAHAKSDRSGTGHDHEEPESLAASLWEVLRTRQGESRGKLAMLLAREDWNGLERYLKTMARSLHNEKNRDRYYQRVRQTMSATPDMGYTPTSHAASYGSLSQDAVCMPSYEELLQTGFCPCFPSIPVNDVRTAATIVTLARDFRKQVENHLGHAVSIPLREFCAYTRAGWPQGTEYEPATYRNPQSDDDETVPRDWPGPNESSNPGRVEHTDAWVSDRAARIALQLEDLDLLLVFCLRYHCDMPLKDIAQALGLSGPSHASYVLDKVHRELRVLLSLEDGLGREDFNENLFARFQDMLLASCKDEDCSRSSRKKADQTRSRHAQAR